MTLRLDPRRLRTLKELAAEEGVRPGDLARMWVEERIDTARLGAGGLSLEDRLAALEARLDALEAARLDGTADREPAPTPAAGAAQTTTPEPEPAPQATAEEAATPAAASEPAAPAGAEAAASTGEPSEAATQAAAAATTREAPATPAPRRKRRVATAAPGGKVALHDEMIAVIAERGPLTASELAEAIRERGRYQPPRSGKPLDAAMVSQRASNPVYRARFVRRDGRIGLAETA